MSALTTELRDEIKRHLRVNPVRHGEVFRAMEQGLDVDQMGTSRANAQSFLNSVEAMLAGILPTTQSAAMRNSYGYRYLLGCHLSPELLSHTKSVPATTRRDQPRGPHRRTAAHPRAAKRYNPASDQGGCAL